MDRARIAEQLAALRSRILGPVQRRGERLSAEQLLVMRTDRGTIPQRRGDSVPPERVARMRLRRGALTPEGAETQDPYLILLEELRQTLEELDTTQQELTRRNEELAAAHQAAEAERRRYRDLFEWAPDGYLVTDAGGVICEANRAAAAMLRTPQVKLVGRTIAGYLLPEARQEFEGRLGELREFHQLSWETHLAPEEGAPYAAALTATSVDAPDGGAGWVRWLLHDMTARKRTESRIQRLNEELERRVADLWTVNRELESFSYSVSHDLRAPLRAIEGFSAILAEEHAQQLDEHGRYLLGVIRANTVRMSALIDDLLAFSRLGRQGMSLQEVDLEALARETFEEVAAGKDRSRLEFVVNPLPRARADRAMLRQVFTNLLSNALKFTRGVERARIEISGLTTAGHHVYSVADNGVGFDMRYADKLFGVFQRLHSSEQFEGTGVGLAIVQRIIQRHGGRVWAEGEPGTGATFHFTLPVQPLAE